jgi:hypothetical protein
MVPYKEYKKDRPMAVAELQTSGELRKQVLTTHISHRRAVLIRIGGYTALGLGVTLIGLIIYSMLFGYR